jgi:hypothetical protein
MLIVGRRARSSLLLLFVSLCVAGAEFAQEPDAALENLVTNGQVTLRGQTRPYIVRHLPASSFPDLPEAVATELKQRGCLIPQTYQAHQPENVVHASFQRAGSSDWAVLCSVKGTVSLLIFFDSTGKASVLDTAPETQRLQNHESNGVLGFNWGIDVASPQVVHDAQIGLTPRPPRLDHDALADSIVDHKTIYRYHANGSWSLLDLPD